MQSRIDRNATITLVDGKWNPAAVAVGTLPVGARFVDIANYEMEVVEPRRPLPGVVVARELSTSARATYLASAFVLVR